MCPIRVSQGGSEIDFSWTPFFGWLTQWVVLLHSPMDQCPVPRVGDREVASVGVAWQEVSLMNRIMQFELPISATDWNCNAIRLVGREFTRRRRRCPKIRWWIAVCGLTDGALCIVCWCVDDYQIVVASLRVVSAGCGSVDLCLFDSCGCVFGKSDLWGCRVLLGIKWVEYVASSYKVDHVEVEIIDGLFR